MSIISEEKGSKCSMHVNIGGTAALVAVFYGLYHFYKHAYEREADRYDRDISKKKKKKSTKKSGS